MTQETQPIHNESNVTITPSALTEIKRLIAEEKDPKGLFLRLGVAAGGCSGISYSMSFDDQATQEDREFDFSGVRVIIEEQSLVYLKECTLDYNGGMLSGGFQFSNPNARRSCGCGSSFSC